MKKINTKKKGFTIVELVIVIAVIGILAAILIPTFINLNNKAKVSNTTSFLKNINTQLAAKEANPDIDDYVFEEKGNRKTIEKMSDGINYADDVMGFNIRKISPFDGNEIVWDMENHRFALIKDRDFSTPVYSEAGLKEVNAQYLHSNQEDAQADLNAGKNIYLNPDFNTSDGKLTSNGASIDATDNMNITEINIESDGDKDVYVSTNNKNCNVVINTPNADAYHDGIAGKVDLKSVPLNSYHENGTVQLIAVKEGHVELDSRADVNGIYVYNNSDGDNKDTEFKEIKITVTEGVDIPKLSRSAVEIADEGTKVCTLVTDQAKDVYLFNEGIYEQIKTVDEGKPITDESATWADSNSNTANTQTAAQQLANEWTGDAAPVWAENDETRELANIENKEEALGVDPAATEEEIAAAIEAKVEDSGKTVEQAESSSALKGTGTETDPFLVYDYETMQKISDFYDLGYYHFAVDLAKTDNGKIDLKNNVYIKLNGSFDGEGVKLVNVNAGIFSYVGSCSSTAKKVTLSNFDVVFDGGFGIVQACATPILEFNNVNVAGYLLEDWNAAAFLRYGSADAVSGGFDYSVSFNNCSSRAEIYSSTNSYSAILVGHGYQGSGNTVTINVDSETDNNINNTILYYTGTGAAFGYKYYCMTSGNTVVNVNNEQQYSGGWANFTNNKMTGNNVVAILSNKVPTKTSEGDYQLTPEVDTAKIVVSLNWQYTEWATNYSAKIDNLSGVGGTFSDKIVIEVEDDDSVVVFDKITSIEIRTGQSEWGYEFNNGKLILNMTTSNPYIDGHVTLIVEQFTRGSSIAKYKGSLELATKTTSAEWVIK